ncbi:MAG: 30S ribosomal protein S3ae [Thermoplasmata archaeon]
MAKRDRVAKRVKDRWKAKGWYTIHAPEMFNRAVLGETPSEDVSKLLNRVTEVTVQDLTGDFSKMHIKVQFRVNNIKGSEASTTFTGHDMTADYIRRLTRRKRSRIDGTFDVKTKDGAIMRVKPMAITDRRIQSSKQSAIRKVMHRVIYERAVSMTLAEFVKAMILGDMAREVAVACKSVQPIFRVEIRKSELLKMPEAVEEEEKIEEAVEAPPEEEEVEEAAPAS